MSTIFKQQVKLFDKYNKVNYMDKDTKRGNITFWCAMFCPGLIVGLVTFSLALDLISSVIYVLVIEIASVSIVTLLFNNIDPYRNMAHVRKKIKGNENHIDSTSFAVNALKFLGYKRKVIDPDIIVDDSILVYICDDVLDSDVENAQKVAVKHDADSIYILTCYHTNKHVSSNAGKLAVMYGIPIINLADVLQTVHNKIQQQNLSL